MNYDTLEAGRELDVLVAEKVMGWKRPGRGRVTWTTPSGFGSSKDGIPQFSVDILSAWQVVEKLKGRAFISVSQRTEYQSTLKGGAGEYGCCIDGWDGDEFSYIEGDADAAPLAICRAALKAVDK